MKTTALIVAAAAMSMSLAEAKFEDVQQYEVFDATTCVTAASSLKSGATYPETLMMSVPFEGQLLDLELEVNRELFSPEWELVDGETGKIISNDASAYMCHYVGKVAGQPESSVSISVCNEAGINGLIETPAFTAEIQPVEEDVAILTTTNLGSHVIYNLNDLVLPEGLKYDHILLPEDLADKMNATATDDVGTMQAYVNNLVTASDNLRMRQYSSSNAEVSNTQSVVSARNQRYTSTQWNNGNTLRIQLARQVTNANIPNQSSNLSNYLRGVASWKGSNQPNSDNVQGLTAYNQGGTIGVAYINTMCQRSNSAGINNVGFSSSTTARGVLVAHEMGHNFNMQHDGGNGFVMSSSINQNAARFSTQSVSNFNSRRGAYNCL